MGERSTGMDVFVRKFKRKLKENRATDFLKVVRQVFGKLTKRYIAKEAPSLVDVPLGLGSRID